MFGNPCRGTHKYLEVEYSCVPTRKFQNIDFVICCGNPLGFQRVLIIKYYYLFISFLLIALFKLIQFFNAACRLAKQLGGK